MSQSSGADGPAPDPVMGSAGYISPSTVLMNSNWNRIPFSYRITDKLLLKILLLPRCWMILPRTKVCRPSCNHAKGRHFVARVVLNEWSGCKAPPSNIQRQPCALKSSPAVRCFDNDVIVVDLKPITEHSRLAAANYLYTLAVK